VGGGPGAGADIGISGGDAIKKQVKRIKPCLIVCPKTLTSNWKTELLRWGHFLLDIVGDGSGDDAVIQKLTSGHTEILICSNSKLKRVADKFKDVAWGIVVYDEAHEYLKNRKTEIYQHALKISKVEVCFMLTGTPVQNDLEEFWSLMNVVKGQRWHSYEIYKDHFIEPIKQGLSTKATENQRILRERREEEHAKDMKEFYLGRKKETLQGPNKLKGKKEMLVLCDPSSLQKKLYSYTLSLPDVENCRDHEKLCPCGKGENRRN
jgi:SNF2 family DNA or RNA helicase